MTDGGPIDRYVLYGEPVREVELNFLHVETIPVRSRRHRWTIAPHAHAELHQIMFVTSGGGVMRAEAVGFPIDPPALLVIPSATVHGFEFSPGTDGWVALIADAMVAQETGDDPDVAALLSRARSIGELGEDSAAVLLRCFETLMQELVWAAPARRLAIRAEVLRLFATSARLVERDDGQPVAASSDLALTDRFRRQIDRDFRRGEPVSAYARVLGVSEDRLLAVCQRRFGEPPLAMIHRRAVLEAQRWLIYTNRGIAEIARELGFGDPAYFSRFFKRRTGCTPREFRERRISG